MLSNRFTDTDTEGVAMRTQSSKKFFVLALAIALGTAGCASGGGGGGSTRPAGATSDRIVQAELDAIPQMNAYLAMERLRSSWLRTRSGDAPTLYVDGARRGSVQELQSIMSSEVGRMERLSASDATNRFGTGHSGGAILVTSR
jgi:hypothetical protein